MLRIQIGTLLAFLFAVAIAIVILRWMRAAEETVEASSERASDAISNVADNISQGVNGLGGAIETGAKSVREQLS